MFPEAAYSAVSCVLEADSTVLLSTDGITEARSDSGEFFGAQRLEAFLRTQSSTSSRETVDSLISTVNSFYGTSLPNDDRTVVVFRVPSVSKSA